MRVSVPEAPAARRWTLALSTDQLAIAAAAYIAAAFNGPFVAGMLGSRDWATPGGLGVAAAMLVMVAALHALLLALVLERHVAKPILAFVFLAGAVGLYYMRSYGVYFDATMMRNVLNTTVPEAGELVGWGLLGHVAAYAGVPALLLTRVRLVRRPPARALLGRAMLVAGAALLFIGAVWSVFQDFSSTMRNQRELRYLVTPANLAYSTLRVAVSDARVAAGPRRVVGADAKLAPSWAARAKPVLLVLVVGETARAMSWGLGGYARQTTPQLARLGVLDFGDVSACGTNTEVSLPCMFAPVGRRDYDEARIRGSESLLHLLSRAGFRVLWRDNQSGCKGVCDGLPQERTDAARTPALCRGGHCLDEALLEGLDGLAREPAANRFVVLHMLGNHGPAYFERYPAAFRRFTPACETAELRRCSREEIVNAYDNALLYTDHVLAQLIARLGALAERYDTAMVFVSDHGESLGENGLYLHGLPYAIAPAEQLKVPMSWWLSPGFVASFGLDRGCLAARARQPASHDHLFHSVLGLLQVEASEYAAALDLTRGCRRHD